MPRPHEMDHEIPPHERPYFHERPPHEEIFERLDRIEDALKRIENKLR